MLLVSLSAQGSRSQANNRALAKKGKAYTIEQINDSFGALRTYVDYNDASLRTSEMRLIIRTPNPTVVMINDDDKLYCQRQMGSVDGPISKELEQRDKILVMKPGATKEIAGVKANEYIYTSKDPLRKFQLDCWCTKELSISPELADACCIVLGHPNLKGHGMPLRMVIRNAAGREFVVLDTRSIQQTDQQHDFSTPKGYQRVASSVQLMGGPFGESRGRTLPFPVESDAGSKSDAQKQKKLPKAAKNQN
jgi:hypothetical protein